MPPPERARPPNMSQAYLEGMKISSEEIREVTGQYQAELGMEGNEKSGVAIQQRQRQGDNATYHYIDNLAIAIKRTGKILIEIIPLIYDTQRVMKIMTAEGKENQVTIDPNAQDAYSEKATSKNSIESIFNPNVGKYDVEAEVGPDNGTQRQEAFKALSGLMQADKDLMKIGGDILVKMADFPMADVLAERLKRAVPPALLGEAPPAADQKLIEQNQELTKQNQDLTKQAQSMQDLVRKQSEAVTVEKSKNLTHQEQKAIDTYKAVTDRLKILLPLVTSPAEQAQMAHEIMMAEHSSDLAMLQASHSSVMNILQANAMPQPQNDTGEDQPQQAAE
jgi:portal protein